MSKGKWHPVDSQELSVAYDAWPAAPYAKGAMLALILRVRIEGVVSALPATVVRNVGMVDNLHRRLLLSLGEPDLTEAKQKHRHLVVIAAIAAHRQICHVLHGRDLGRYPQTADLAEWALVVNTLELEFGIQTEEDGGT